MAALSSLSMEYVRVPVTAKEAGAAVNPTAGTVEMAFKAPGTEPGSGDWKTASWETDATRDPDRFFARCLVGPGGTVVLTDGVYQVWVKVSGISPEIPVERAPGTLTIT